MTKEEADIGRCTHYEPKQILLQSGRKWSNRCLLDEGHQAGHNYQNHKKDEKMLRRFLNNRSERGMI